MSSVLTVDVSVKDTELWDEVLDILRYAYDRAEQEVKDEIDKKLKGIRMKQADDCLEGDQA